MTTQNFSEYNEIIDIVDEHDNKTHSMLRADAIAQKTAYRRLVFVFLKNPEGKLCFLQRANHLSYHPGSYALVGGGVQAGETYEQALLRETEEEVSFIPRTYKLLEILSPKEIQGQCFKAVYEVEADEESITCVPTAFSSCIWLTPQELLDQNATGTLCPVMPDLIYFVNRFYGESINDV